MNDEDLEVLGRYLARRDVEEPVQPVDLLVLMGSAVLESVEVAAGAFLRGVTERILVSGGVGHSTRYLVEAIEHAGLAVETAGRAESHIFRDLLVQRGVEAAAIEVEDQSANCGENAEFTRRHLRGQQADAGQRVQSKTTLLLVQDPTMQRRTHASFVRAFSGTGTELISFAPPIGTPPWSKQRYISLVLGELRRLHDTPEGYGPCGRNYIDHIDIPHDVLLAYRNVAEAFPELVRAPGG